MKTPFNLKKINLAVLDQALISICNFSITLILARFMIPNEFGLYVFAFTVLVLCIGILNSLIGTPMNTLGASSNDTEWSKLLSNFVLIFFVVTIIIILIFYFLSLFLKKTQYADNGTVFNALSIIIPLYLGQEFIRRILLTKFRLGSVLLLDAATYLSRIGFVLLIIFYGFKKCDAVLYIFGLTSLFGMGFGCFFLRYHSKFEIRNISYESILMVWRYSRWTLAGLIPFVVCGQLIIYFVTFLSGNEATGIIGACRNLIAPVAVLEVGISNFLLPYYSKLYNTYGIDKTINSLKNLFIILAFPVTLYLVSVSVFAKPILSALFSQYSEYWNVVILFAIGEFINFFLIPAELYLLSALKPKYVFLARIFVSIPILITSYFLIAFFNINGALYSFILSHSLVCFSMYFFMIFSVNKDKKVELSVNYTS